MWLLIFAACTTSAPPPAPAPLSETAGPTPLPAAEAPALNHPPKVVSFLVAPETPTAGDRLVATLVQEDEDHDPVRVSYSWRINGEEQPSVVGPELPSGRAVHGDKVELLATLDDGNKPISARFGPITIANRPPELAPESLHPTHLDSFTPVATDPDGDPITWSLGGGAPGLTMDPNGTLRHVLPPDATPGNYEVRIIASDGLGGTVELRLPVTVTAVVKAR